MVYLLILVQRCRNNLLKRWYSFRKIPYVPLIDFVIQKYYDSGANAGYKRQALFRRPWLDNEYPGKGDFTYEEVRQAVYNRTYSRGQIVDEYEFFRLLKRQHLDKSLIDFLRHNSVSESIKWYPNLMKPIPISYKLEEYL